MVEMNRRKALVTFGAGAGLASFGQVALAFEAADQISLIDSRIDSSLAKSLLPASGTPAVVLGDNPVRQWRDGLSGTVADAGQAIALVRWDKAVMLQGLAREEGFHATMRRTPGRLICVVITH